MSANAAFSYIDPKFLSDAEVDIKDFFQTIEIPIEYKLFKELVAIDPKHEKYGFPAIQKQYKYCVSATKSKLGTVSYLH